MTTARSVFSEKSLAYFRYKLRRNRKITAVLVILNAIGFPLVYLTSLLNGIYKKLLPADAARWVVTRFDDINTVFVIVAFIALACALTAGVFVVFSVFDYLYDKTLVDMAYSAPLTGKQRYWMDFSAGLTMYVGPFIGGSILGLIFCGMMKLFQIPDYVMPELSLLWGLILHALLAMFMLFAMTTFVAVCCGSLFESVVYTGILNGIIPAVIYAGYYTALEGLYGITNFGSLANALFFRVSPIGVVISHFSSYVFVGDQTRINVPWIFTFLIPVLLVIAAYTFISFLLYKRRKAESTGRPFVFKLLYYVLITSITLVITSLFLTNREYDLLLPAVILTGVLYLIMEVITNRGFKGVWKSILRFAGTFACSVLVVALVKETDAFGMPYRVPSASSVRSVKIENYESMAGGQRFDLTLTSKEDIEKVIAVHNEMVQMYRDRVWPPEYVMDADLSWQASFYANLQYTLNSGRVVERRYNVPERVYRQWMALPFTKDGKEQRAGQLDTFAQSSTGVSLESIYGTNEIELVKLLDPVDGYIRTEVYNGFSTKEFLNALKKDIMAETMEQYYTPSAQPVAQVQMTSVRGVIGENNRIRDEWFSYGAPTSFLIKAHYTNTIAYLEQIGLSGYLKNNLDNLLTSGNFTYFLKQPDLGYEWEERSASDYGSFERYLGPTMKRLGDSEKIRQLVRVAQPAYYADENCFRLFSNRGGSFLIPPEYAALAQEVFGSPEVFATESYQFDEKDREFTQEYAEKFGRFPEYEG